MVDPRPQLFQCLKRTLRNPAGEAGRFNLTAIQPATYTICATIGRKHKYHSHHRDLVTKSVRPPVEGCFRASYARTPRRRVVQW